MDNFTNNQIEMFNSSITQNPQVFSISFLAIRYISWSLLFGTFELFGGVGSPELAFGYMFTKVTGKFRQPANIALAPILSHLFPVLPKVKVSALMGIFSDSPPNPHQQKNWMTKLHDSMAQNCDRYGFSLYLAAKINVVLQVCVSSMMIGYGVDLAAILGAVGISEAVQAGAGSMAAATLTNFVFIPFHMKLTTFWVPHVRKILSWFEHKPPLE